MKLPLPREVYANHCVTGDHRTEANAAAYNLFLAHLVIVH